MGAVTEGVAHQCAVKRPSRRRSAVRSDFPDRAKFVLKEKSGYAYDEVSAVFRAGSDDLVDVEKRLKALKAIRKTRNFEPLAVSFKRIRKILEKANLPAGDVQPVNTQLFEKDAERSLYAAVRKAAASVVVDKRMGKYQEALEEIAGLRKAVDGFEEVMVMAEDQLSARTAWPSSRKSSASSPPSPTSPNSAEMRSAF